MKKLNLNLHAGGKVVTREELLETETPSPTETWYPIPHHLLLDQVSSTLERTGLKVINESHALAHEGKRYFGLMQVANGENAEDFSVVIGLRNSCDRKFPAGIVVGSGVFVCSNLAFSGEIKIARRHTRFIMRDLPQLVTNAMGKLGDHRKNQELRFENYKALELSDAQANDLLIQSLDAQIMPVTKLPGVLEEWRHPRHHEFAENKTAWRLMNSFTECMKSTDLGTLPKRTMALMGLLDATVLSRNVVVPAVASI